MQTDTADINNTQNVVLPGVIHMTEVLQQHKLVLPVMTYDLSITSVVLLVVIYVTRFEKTCNLRSMQFSLICDMRIQR